jgi:hypothetical protein
VWVAYGYQDQADYELWHDKTGTAWTQLNPDERELARQWLGTQDDPIEGKPINRRWPLPADIAERLLDELMRIATGANQTDEPGAGARTSDQEPSTADQGEQAESARTESAEPAPPVAAAAEFIEQAKAKGSEPEYAPGEGPSGRTPSMAQLQREGVRPEDLEAAESIAAAMDHRTLRTELVERGLPVGGKVDDLRKRYIAALAEESARMRHDAQEAPQTEAQDPGTAEPQSLTTQED